MRKQYSVRVVEASGSAHKLGFEIGSQCQDLVRDMVEDRRRELKQKYNMDWDRARVVARKYLSFCQAGIPKDLEELRGYAKGAGLEIEDIFTLFCTYRKGEKHVFGCTDLVVSAGLTEEQHILMAHNEDAYAKEAKEICLVRGNPENAPAFLAVTFGGLIFSSGLNAAGLGFGLNTVTPTDTRVGIPIDRISRVLYSAKTIVEALTSANLPNRESSYNNVVADSHGQIYSIEGSATEFELIYAGGSFLVHTNHYLTDKMKKYESSIPNDTWAITRHMCSVARFNRASSLLGESEKISLPKIISIMRDHVNHPWSICRHVDEDAKPEYQVKTVYSSIADLTAQELWVCYGNPCSAEYERYML